MAQIFVIDDDPAHLDQLKNLLEKQGHVVHTALQGLAAIKKINKNDEIEIVISSLTLSQGNGNQVLNWLRLHRNHIKVILLSTEEEAQNFTHAEKSKADAFSPKPVTEESLKKAIDLSLEPIGFDSDISYHPDKFGRVDVLDFISQKEIEHPIYVKLSNDNFYLIAHPGDLFAPEEVKKLIEKGIHYIYLKEKDFDHYLDINTQLVKATVLNKKVNFQKKTKTTLHTAELLCEQIRMRGLNDQNFAEVKELFKIYLNNTINEIDAEFYTEMLYSFGRTPYSHCSFSAIIATLLTQVMGWSSEKNSINLILGAYFHDIGMIHYSDELFFKLPTQMTAEEMKEYFHHPIKGAQMLSQLKEVPKEVIDIVQQHHENIFGTGFPKQMKKSSLFPMTRVITAIDYFCEIVQQILFNRENKLEYVLDELQSQNPTYFDESTMLALRCLIKEKKVKNAKLKYEAQS
ncbi:MAG: hypothetical protein CL678_11125 [Bdellovibrionaceae bacterium]|nr:hypothetical protein [Pseudobdellovibrionaceae bacterium]|tara:strand:+ start:933 stop:2309 length:1377 start_codon:yes stop_codon:yes gene_type:complete